VFPLATTIDVLSTKYGWLSRKLKKKNPVNERKQRLMNLLCELGDSVEKGIASILISLVYKDDIISLPVILQKLVPHYRYETWSETVRIFFLLN